MNRLLIASVLAMVAAGPALADNGPRSQAVHYADLDLTRIEGRAALDRRLEQAIRAVCGARIGTTSLLETAQARSCARQARSQARRGAQLALARARRAAGEEQLAVR